MGEFRRIAGVPIEDVHGSRSSKGIPYVPRDCELDVEQRLQHRRLLIVGPALSGKTRLAFQLIREIFPEHGFVDAADGRALRAMLEADPGQPRLVIWLDDLPNFLGAEPVTGDVLDLLYSRGNVLVATMDNDSHYRASSDDELRPSGWGVPAWFGEPVRLTDWSDRELERAALRGVPDQVLESANRAGLSVCVGGGPVLLRWLGAGVNSQPVGYAMVRAAGDWQRTGTTEALTRSHLVDLLPAYLNNAPITADTDAIATGLAWALTRVNGATLLEQRGAGYHLHTHIGRHLQVENENIPQALWDAVLHHTSPRDLITVGYTAATNHDRRDIARAAYTLAIDTGDPPAAAQAALYLGRVCQRDGDPNAATAAYRIARESGHPEYGPLAAAWLADAELSFFAPEQALRLRRLTREAFLARGLDVTMFSDYVEGADGTEYGLQDMAARCFNAPGGESQWVEIIGQYVDTILGAVQQYDALDNLTLDEIFSRTYLRVYDRSFAGETDGYDYGRPIVGDLVELFVLDYPDSVRLLHRTELDRFERATLHSAALSNLLAAPIDRYEVFVDDGATMHVAYGQSVHIASKLLILPDVLRRTVGEPEPPHGVLVCVPNRHEIAFHPIVDESVLPSLEHLNQFAAHGYAEGVGSVSPFVYWWQQGNLTQLTHYDADGQIVIEVDDDFGIVLDKVARDTYS